MRSTIVSFVRFLPNRVTWFCAKHSEFFSKSDAFFKTHIKNGRVQYKTISNDTAELDGLLELANGISVTTDKANEYQSFLD